MLNVRVRHANLEARDGGAAIGRGHELVEDGLVDIVEQALEQLLGDDDRPVEVLDELEQLLQRVDDRRATVSLLGQANQGCPTTTANDVVSLHSIGREWLISRGGSNVRGAGMSEAAAIEEGGG